jgi:hypothetical protein
MAQNITLMGADYTDVPGVALPKTGGGTATFYDVSDTTAGASDVFQGKAIRGADGSPVIGTLAKGIPFAQVDDTSTSTVFTATVPGVTEYKDGVCVMLKNGVVTSAAGFTINVNGLGAKPVYSSMAAASQSSTIFNVAYTMLFVYDEDRVTGGCWVVYYGYDSNTNTIGYQLRTNSSTRPASDKFYRYRLLFTSADGKKWVPANTSSSTNATAARTPNTKAIDPFGPIVYYGSTTAISAGDSPGVAVLWQEYTLSLGYSFNTTGAALTLTYPGPVFLKCTPQSDGSALLGEVVQALPNTNDGKIYIYLGDAYSETHIELRLEHPVYYHDGTGIRAWIGKDPSSGGGVSSVTVSQTVQSGTEIAEIAVDGTTTKLYTPTIPAPLIGSTATITPSEVATALAAGRTVYISYTDLTVGQIVASYFNTSVPLGVIISNVIAYIGTALASVTLVGTLANDTWSSSVTYLQSLLDPVVQYLSVNGTPVLPTQAGYYDVSVPTNVSDLNNDSGFLTSAVTSFNGSTGAVTYTAPVTSVNGNTGAITGLQTTGNLVTAVSSASTDSQYPSAKCLYDMVGNIESLLAAI